MIRQRNLKDMEKDEILRIINKIATEQNIKNQIENQSTTPTSISNPPTFTPVKIPPTPIKPPTPPLPIQTPSVPNQIPPTSVQPPSVPIQIPPTQTPIVVTSNTIMHPPVARVGQQIMRPPMVPTGPKVITQIPKSTNTIPTPTITTPTITPTTPIPTPTSAPTDNSRLELLIDDHMIEKKINVMRRVHEPVPGDIAIKFDQPWEGNVSAYYTVIRETKDWLRLYYRAGSIDINALKLRRTVTNGQRTCYAESRDGGMTWVKPTLGLFEYPSESGNTANNIIWVDERSTENFTPFKDTNPNCDPNMVYKAIGSRLNPYLLYAMVSSDGINWRMIREDPILTIYHGKFDTQNVVFWNNITNKYMMFYRDCIDRRTNAGRGIKVATSDNFINWSGFLWLNWTTDRFSQEEYQLYTNSIQQYYRAPHIMVGFPNRFNQERVGHPGHPQTGVFDSILISSRDGINWSRTSEAIFRPGQQKKRWASRNNLMALNMYESRSRIDDTIPELTILTSEGYYLDVCSLRRYTWRLDGFVSINAGFQEGELITKPFILKGRILVLNLSTSAMGWIKVEVQDPAKGGTPYPGCELQNCHETFGDSVSQMVNWKPVTTVEEVEDTSPLPIVTQSPKQDDPDLDIDDKLIEPVISTPSPKRMKQVVRLVREGYDLSELNGKQVQLRFRMKDCDLYSFQFVK